MRVVLDTNAVVSALLFSGISSELVSLWQKGLITLLLSREILDEYLRVFSYP
ncbi:MAG: putative toxin-antitoxin system toxin component, PIN family, partial [Candidatus Binatia bacterium]